MDKNCVEKMIQMTKQWQMTRAKWKKMKEDEKEAEVIFKNLRFFWIKTWDLSHLSNLSNLSWGHHEAIGWVQIVV